MCAPIGRSKHRVMIAPCFARIAGRTDTSPVRSARASPGIDSDTASRFPALPESDGRARLCHLLRRGCGIAAKRLRPSARRGRRRAFSSPGHITSLPAPGSCGPPGFVGWLDPGCESIPTMRGSGRPPRRASTPQPFRRRLRSIPARECREAEPTRPHLDTEQLVPSPGR